MSIGIGLPMFGLWSHRYIPVKRKRDLDAISFLGIHIVFTTYKRLDK